MGFPTISTRRPVGALALGALVAALAAPAHAQGAPSAVAKGFDAVLLRPLGFFALVVGAGLFVPAAIITAPNGRDSVQEARDLFVKPFYDSVFQRPLGDF